jgi:ParB family chromosome partitioning protein
MDKQPSFPAWEIKGVAMALKSELDKRLAEMEQVAGSFGVKVNESVIKVSIESIKPDPEQPRKYFSQEEIDSLAESIKSSGLLQPIVIDDNGVIVMGERRYRAILKLGWKEVPVIKRKYTEADRRLAAFSENYARANLTSIEVINYLLDIKDRFKYSVRKIAEFTNIPKSTVSLYIKVGQGLSNKELNFLLDKPDIGIKKIEAAVKLSDKPDVRISIFQELLEGKSIAQVKKKFLKHSPTLPENSGLVLCLTCMRVDSEEAHKECNSMSIGDMINRLPKEDIALLTKMLKQR